MGQSRYSEADSCPLLNPKVYCMFTESDIGPYLSQTNSVHTCTSYKVITNINILVTRMQGKIVTEIDDRSFENMAQFNYLGTTVTNRNLIQEEIKRRLNSGNVCYHSVQKIVSFRLLSRKN
jgi:hypothetical protein